MKNGGKRPGAGRPRGLANIKTRALAEKVLADGVSPLEVMIKAMHEHYAARRWDDAAAAAKDAAPYVHPKLASIEHGGHGGGPMQAVIFTGALAEQAKNA